MIHHCELVMRLCYFSCCHTFHHCIFPTGGGGASAGGAFGSGSDSDSDISALQKQSAGARRNKGSGVNPPVQLSLCIAYGVLVYFGVYATANRAAFSTRVPQVPVPNCWPVSLPIGGVL